MSVGLGGSPAASNQILFYSFFSWFPALGEGKKKRKKDGTVPAQRVFLSPRHPSWESKSKIPFNPAIS